MIDFDINGENIPCPEDLTYLGVNLGKSDSPDLINIEPQLAKIYKKMCSAKAKVLAVKNYGTTKQLITLYNSLAVGFFSHGLDCQPMLSQTWYSKFQLEFCNFLNKLIVLVIFVILGFLVRICV